MLVIMQSDDMKSRLLEQERQKERMAIQQQALMLQVCDISLIY